MIASSLQGGVETEGPPFDLEALILRNGLPISMSIPVGSPGKVWNSKGANVVSVAMTYVSAEPPSVSCGTVIGDATAPGRFGDRGEQRRSFAGNLM